MSGGARRAGSTNNRRAGSRQGRTSATRRGRTKSPGGLQRGGNRGAPSTSAKLSAVTNRIFHLPLANLTAPKALLTELCETEKCYVDDLRTLIDVYLKPLRVLKLLPDKDVEAMFLNLEVMLPVHTNFHSTISSRIQHLNIDSIQVGDALLRLTDISLQYRQYFQQYVATTLGVLATAMQEVDAFRTFVHLRKTFPQIAGISLEALLLRPVQRCALYPLYIQRYLALISAESKDRTNLNSAARRFDAVVAVINEGIRLADLRTNTLDHVAELKARESRQRGIDASAPRGSSAQRAARKLLDDPELLAALQASSGGHTTPTHRRRGSGSGPGSEAVSPVGTMRPATFVDVNWFRQLRGRAESTVSFVDKEEEVRELVIGYIINTEKDFTSDLDLIVKHFVEPMQTGRIVSSDILASVFGNLTDVLALHTKLLAEIEASVTAAKGTLMIGEALHSLYTSRQVHLTFQKSYVNHLPIVRAERSKNKKLDEFLRSCDSIAALAGRTLHNLLSMVPLRYMQYPALLRELLYYTPAKHMDHANILATVEKLEVVAKQTETGIRVARARERANDVTQVLDGRPASLDLMASGRQYIRTGLFVKISKRKFQQRRFWLFSDVLVYARFKGHSRKTQQETWTYRGHVDLSMAVVSSASVKNVANAIQMQRFEDKHKVIILVCNTAQEYTDWFADLDRITRKLLKPELRKPAGEFWAGQGVETDPFAATGVDTDDDDDGLSFGDRGRSIWSDH